MIDPGGNATAEPASAIIDPPPAGFLAHSWAPQAVLLFATALWGLAFLIVQLGVARVPPMPFIAVRFATASLIVRLLTGARMAQLTPMEVRAGPLIGLAMLAGYGLQATGLTHIGAGRAAFIGALYVPMVPLLQRAVFGTRASAQVWISTALATAGMMVLAAPAPGQLASQFGRGEALCLAGSVAVAAELMLMGHFAPRVDPRRLAVLECLFVSAGCVLLALAQGQSLPAFAPFWVACALGLGAASAFLQVSSNWAMRRVPAQRAMLIFATEPVWGGVFGALHGEPMGLGTLAGAGLIVGALLVHAWG